MKVLICGGRKFYDKVLFRYTMNMLHADTPITLIIHGGINGADWLAKYWAAGANVPSQVYNDPSWLRKGRRTGPRRNYFMLKESKPDVVVAFPGGSDTADMVKKAKKYGIKVVEVEDIKRSFDIST